MTAIVIEPSNLDDMPAIRWGRENEVKAREMYTLYTGLQIEPAGFFIDPRWPYLGPSPDGIIDSQAIVEIKYPYKHREEKLGLHNVDL